MLNEEVTAMIGRDLTPLLALPTITVVSSASPDASGKNRHVPADTPWALQMR
jgi:hypothetical protein